MDEIHESVRLIREVRRCIPSGTLIAEATRSPQAGKRVSGRCQRSRGGEAKSCMSSWQARQGGFTGAKCEIRPSCIGRRSSGPRSAISCRIFR